MRGVRAVGLLLVVVGGMLVPPVGSAQELSVEASGLFFENPRFLVEQNAYFPLALESGGTVYVVYQEVVRRGPESGEIYISIAASARGRSWEYRRRIAGPIAYDRESPPVVFSAEVDEDGNIYLALVDSPSETRIVVSSDGGESFSEAATLETQVTSVAPRLFVSSDGGLLLFVNQNVGATQSILYSYSADGRQWSSFDEIVTEPEIGFNFLPDHARLDGRDYVVFQSVNPTEAPTYQLYLKESTDGGRSWGPSQLLSDFQPLEAGDSYLDYDNQRPFIEAVNGNLALVWERQTGTRTRRIFYADIGPDGNIRGRPESVSGGLDPANYPQIVRHNGRTFVMWFTNPFGSSDIRIAARVRGLWRSRTLSSIAGASTFSSPIVHRGRLHVFWQNRRGEGAPSLVYLEPDQRAAPPELRAANFVPDRRSSQERASFTWEPPDDPSGIAGYNATWSRNPNAFVPRRIEYEPLTQSASFAAPEDGEWYLRIIAVDRAGNWSAPETLSFFRDTTPPPPVVFEEPETDEDGFLTSNTFTLGWEPPEAEDVAGYSVTLRRIARGGGDAPREYNASVQLPQRVVTRTPSISRNNIDNGLWALSVAPVDTVGNIGETRTMFVRFDKYIPVTEVYRIATTRDMLNRYNLTIDGRGFTANGVIDRVILDADGAEPYDHVFSRSEGDFRLADNRNIDGLTVDNIDTGRYEVILSHTGRGLYRVRRALSFEAPGTVTFGDFRIAAPPSFSVGAGGRWSFDGWEPLVWVSVALLGLLALFSGTRLVAVAREGRELRLEVQALIASEPMPREQKEQRLEVMSRKRTSLRVKFSVFVVVLVVSVILALALILGNTALERQEQTLARGLEQRVEVLLDSVTTQAEDLLVSPADNRVDLATLSDQANVMAEGLYVTITGPARDGSGFDAVWATSDDVLTTESTGGVPRTLSTESFVPGESGIEDPVSGVQAELEGQINETARQMLGDIPVQLAQVRQELTNLLRQGVAPDDPELLDLDETQRELQQRQNEILDEVGNVFRSVPAFEPEELSTENTEYVFYQPVVFARAQDDPETAPYFRGIVRLGISTELILEEIDTARRQLIISTAIVALGALAGGIGGALLLATIVVIPIRRLVDGVAVIRDTEQKEKLRDHVIDVRTRDELSELAETVNSMTRGLVKAAEANKDLSFGKELQKEFLPLEKDNSNKKLSMAREVLPEVEFSGYYEGAKGVSGDYFRYQRLDEDHWAVIKCDISGKGISAALIMVQVATMFTSYFRDWTLRSKGLGLKSFVTQVNDIIASMGFSGKFAAFVVGILNIKTGKMRLCNAGDTKMHVFDAGQREMVIHDLADNPSAGPFPSDDMLFEMKVPNGFQENVHQMKAGDILVLFTDGIEEAKRILRDETYAPVTVGKEDYDAGRLPEWLDPYVKDGRVNHDEDSGEFGEEFGVPRVQAVVNAFQNGRRYRLEKLMDPDGDDELIFDFSDVEKNIENLVLALVSVEKIYRMYRPREVTQDDRVQIDIRIDDFLKSHFRQYDRFFRYPVDLGEDTQYRYYARVREDEQYDDLTVLAVEKK